MFLTVKSQQFVDSQGQFNRMALLEVVLDAISAGRLLLGDIIPDILHVRLASVVKKYLFGAASLFWGGAFQYYGIEKSFLKTHFRWYITYITFPLILRLSEEGCSTINLLHFAIYMVIVSLNIFTDRRQSETQKGTPLLSHHVVQTNSNTMIDVFRSKIVCARVCEIAIAAVLVKVWRSFISVYGS